MRTNLLRFLIIPMLLVLLFASTTAALSASTDKETYYPGDALTVSGTATPNAIVSITVYNPNNELVAIDQVTAGGDGSFTKTVLTFPDEPTATIPLGTYTVVVKDTATNEEESLEVTYEKPAATIQGTVTATDGTPIADATVTVKLGTLTVAVDTTDENGAFSATVSETGTYTIEVTASGYEAATTEVEVTQLPQNVAVEITLEEEKLTIEIESITADGKPMVGVAREGDLLTINAKVSYGQNEITDATVTGYLTSTVREAGGMPPIEFELTYDEHTGAYVGTVQVPSPGVDRLCSLKLVVEYQGMTAETDTEFITLVNTPSELENLTTQFEELSTQVSTLSESITGLQNDLGALQDNLGSLQTTVSSLEEVVQTLQSQVGNLAAKEDLNNLQTQLQQLQEQLNTIQEQVNSVSGAKSLAQGAIAVGIIAIIIALAALAYLNKKIQG